MTFRSISIAAIAVSCFMDFACAAPNETLSSYQRATSVSPIDARLSAYRQYARAQADTLVGMTKVLAGAIKDADLGAAQMAYAPAHRFLARIAPIARALHGLDARMDARAEAYGKKERDPEFSGFHRIEYGLFTLKSTSGLSDYADRLDKGARELRERLAVLDVTPAALIDGAIGELEETAAESLTGDEERYSRTDLWDLEAKVEGARQIVAVLQPQLQAQDATIPAPTAIHFARLDALLEKHKVGCGFKNYDELSQDDRMALEAPIAALAGELAKLRGTPAMN